MNREIKFRGKIIGKESDWWYGFYFKRNTKYYILDPARDCFRDVLEVFPETVGQFIGLCDEKDKEVYEGDIIQQVNFNGEQYTAVYEVVYCADAFCLKMIKGNEKAMEIKGLHSFGHIENNKLRKGVVIGNIHDNPELLKSE